MSGSTLLNALISVLVALACMESGFRVLQLPWFSKMHQPCIYMADPVTGYRYIPGSSDRIHRSFEMDSMVHINSNGFHDREHPVEPHPGTTRILVAGDSFTAAIHVATAAIWTQQLEKTLNSNTNPSSKQWEVINIGLDGSGTNVQLALIREQVAKYRPDRVILAFYENDIEDVKSQLTHRVCYKDYVLAYRTPEQHAALQRYVDRNAPGPWLKSVYETSYSVRGIMALLARFPHTVESPAPLLVSNYMSPSRIGETVHAPADNAPPVWQYLAALSALANQEGFHLTIIALPTKTSVTGSLETLANHLPAGMMGTLGITGLEQTITAILAEQDIPYHQMFWQYDGHFNATGNAVFASAMTRFLHAQEQPVRR